MCQASVDLGYRLNHLINRDTKLGIPANKPGGLILPTETAIGSGNVVIVGEPGVGKSTLAMQICIAAACQNWNSVYFSLEDDFARIYAKAAIFGWESYLFTPASPPRFGGDRSATVGRPSSPDDEGLLDLLKSARQAALTGKVLVPGLLPRPLDHDASRLTAFFWQQYGQVEFLIRSAARLNKRSDNEGGIRLVVIDSLNMLGLENQNREMLHRVFDLFRRNKVIGVFTVESKTDIGFDSTMGDVVLDFSTTLHSDYEIPMIRCFKSRFSKRTRGIHPYKFHEKHDVHNALPGATGIVVFPSLHAVIAATEGETQAKMGAFSFGWGAHITKRLLRADLERRKVVTLAGPTGTFKSSIAFNFLLHGLVNAESVLSIRLREPLSSWKPTLEMLYAEPSPSVSADPDAPSRRKALALSLEEDSDSVLKRLELPGKSVIRVFKQGNMPTCKARLVFVDFHTGMLLPEEISDTVLRLFLECEKDASVSKLERVVFDDVAAIGVSYPLLSNSPTAGNLFLSGFIHILQNRGADVLLVGTLGDLEQSNWIVNQALTIADAQLRTRQSEIFGDRYVLLSGDGMAATAPNAGENPPVVLIPTADEPKMLGVNALLLDEFVGFQEGKIIRPGIVLHLYQEHQDGIHRQYNDDLRRRLQERYGGPTENNPTSGAQVVPFRAGRPVGIDRGDTEAQMPNAAERPRDHTAVTMIDEFEAKEYVAGKASEVKLYWRNVLLIAYHERIQEFVANLKPLTWDSLEKAVASIPSSKLSGMVPFAYDPVAPETMACLVLDALCTAHCLEWPAKDGEQAIKFPKALERPDAQEKEFQALHRLMFKHSGHSEMEPGQREAPLPGNAAVYVCWYSQLREVINKHPGLAGVLRIMNLPGSGFRGDWMLRVEKGSVSVRLGNAIVESLTSRNEDYERFRNGVGLPSGGEFETSEFLAWHGADSSVMLSDVYNLWRGAHRRSKIERYEGINRVLYSIGDTLAGKWIRPSVTNGLQIEGNGLRARLKLLLYGALYFVGVVFGRKWLPKSPGNEQEVDVSGLVRRLPNLVQTMLSDDKHG